MLIAPMAYKEMVSIAGRRRTYWLRMIFAALFFFIIGMTALPMIVGSSFSGTSAAGAYLFQAFYHISAIFLVLIVPAVVGTSITEEKERGTIGLLLATPLGPSDIVIGKLLSRILFVWMLILCLTPVMTILLFLGGVGLGEILIACVKLTFISMILASIAIFFSVFCRKTLAAMIGVYLFLIAWHLFFGIVTVSSMFFHGSPSSVVHFGAFFCPIVAMIGGNSHDGVMASAIAGGTCAMIFFLSWAVAIFRNRALVPILRSERRPSPTGKPAEIHGKAIAGNPLIWKETHRVGRSTRISVYWGVGVVLGLALLFPVVGEYAARIFLFVVAFTVALFYTAAIAASSVTHEREHRTIDLLLISPVRPIEVLLAKILGVWRAIVPLLLLVLIAAMICVGRTMSTPIHLLLISASFLLFVTLLGLMVSVLSRRSGPAVGGTLGLLFLLLAVVPGLAELAGFSIIKCNPYYWIGEAIENAQGWRSGVDTTTLSADIGYFAVGCLIASLVLLAMANESFARISTGGRRESSA